MSKLLDQRALVSQRRIIHIDISKRFSQQLITKTLWRQSSTQLITIQTLHNSLISDLLDRVCDRSHENRSAVSLRQSNRRLNLFHSHKRPHTIVHGDDLSRRGPDRQQPTLYSISPRHSTGNNTRDLPQSVLSGERKEARRFRCGQDEDHFVNTLTLLKHFERVND